MTERYDRAFEYAARKHAGQKRRGGLDYITHPEAVAKLVRERGGDEDTQIAALFHDLLEDTDASRDEILALSNENVLNAVTVLTRRNKEPIDTYLARISQIPMALLVKKCDRLHNLNSAVCADDSFKIKYIRETLDFYWDLSNEIREATIQLKNTLTEVPDDIKAKLP